jgi:hypothetical protein
VVLSDHFAVLSKTYIVLCETVQRSNLLVVICDFFNSLFRIFLISNTFATFYCTYAVKSNPKPDFCTWDFIAIGVFFDSSLKNQIYICLQKKPHVSYRELTWKME